ncbi:MAG: ABC transporter family substrate-binding protein [Acidimicrobiales bacterium]
MSADGAEAVGRRGRIEAFWAERRARWTLPLVIIMVIVIVAIVDHVGAHRIRQVDQRSISDLVPVHGGTATVHLNRPWNGFNPGTPGGADSSTPTLLSSVLPSAYTITPNLAPVLNSNLLRSTNVVSVAPLTIQYVLNPSAVWSDGVPVSAADFVYAWKSQRGTGIDITNRPDAVASTVGYRDVASVTGSPDGKTVTVVFAKPFTDWRMLFSEMVPAHIAEKVGWNHGFAAFNPAVDLSAGPYMLRSVSTAGTAVLVRNPRWWGTPALLGRVTVSDAGGPSSWFTSLGSNNQTAMQLSGFNLGTLNAVSSLPNTKSEVGPSQSFLDLEFNVNGPLTSLVAVRQAIAHSIDRTALLAQTVQSIDPGIVVDNDHLAVPTQPGYAASPAASGYGKPDPAVVKRLLTSAGFHRAPDSRYVDASGKPLTVRMAVETGNPWLAQVGGAIVSQLQAAGITVVTVPLDGEAALAAAANLGEYDMALVSRTAGPFLTKTEGWYSSRPGPPGIGGSTDWSNFDAPAVDQLFGKAAQELNPVTGAITYAQIDELLWNEMVALPLFQEPALTVNGVQLAGAQYNGSKAGLLWNLPLWTTLQPKPKAAT